LNENIFTRKVSIENSFHINIFGVLDKPGDYLVEDLLSFCLNTAPKILNGNSSKLCMLAHVLIITICGFAYDYGGRHMFLCQNDL
jgi:hypothetical protein